MSVPNTVSQVALNTQSTSYVTRPVINLANYNPPCQSSNSTQAVPHQPYQSNPLYYSYQKTNEKRVYQIDEDVMENQSKGFYNIFEKEGNDMTYSDKSFDKIAVHFVCIEASCTKCRAIFPSRSKLYNYLKSGCLEMFLPAFPTQAALSIPIIDSKTEHQSFGSELAFRGWTFASAPITLTSEHLPSDSNANSIACLDTGCGIT